MKRAIVTYAEGAHEELLEVAMPTYEEFARRHGYEVVVGGKYPPKRPPAWNKIPLLRQYLMRDFSEVVWFDCDLVVVDPSQDFPPISHGCSHALVRHFDADSEVPNSGVWRLRRDALPLVEKMWELDVFINHGWWEQAAMLTLMGYCVPPQGSHFPDTKCRCVYRTKWYNECDFMRLSWNSHPNYRAEKPRIVHCSYPDMAQRLEVMRALVRDPAYSYPRFESTEEQVAKAYKLGQERMRARAEGVEDVYELGVEEWVP